MNIPFFNLSRQNQLLKTELQVAFDKVLEGSQFILGDQVRLFEKRYADYLGTKHCVSCANGTDALEIVLSAMGIGSGDEVLVPAFGWVSPYLAVKSVGATPVLVDVELGSGNMDATDLSTKINPKSKAVIPIHLYGAPSDIISIRYQCLEHKLWLIEDTAQAHGAQVNGKKCGTFGDVATFSFYPTKNLGAFGDAGAIVTNDEALSKTIRSIANYGKEGSLLGEEGRNSRLDEIQAAFLSAKMNHLTAWNERRQAIAKSYFEALDRPDLFNQLSIYHQFVLRVERRERFREGLSREGIDTAIHYDFIVGNDHESVDCKNAKTLSVQVVSLPIFPELTDEEISYICEQLKKLRKFVL